MRNILTTILLLATLTVSAQNYSPCYKEKYAQGVELYNKGDYNGAKAKFVAAKGCPMPNAEAADAMIRECDAKLKQASKKTPPTPPAPPELPKVSVKTDSKGNKVFTIGDVTFKMVKVEGGTFTMGCTPEQGNSYCGGTAHQVTVSGYFMGEAEVTQALWKAVMRRTWTPSSYSGNNLPIENVSQNECQDFIRELNQLTGMKFRLPTEAEWEYAARGGKYHSGYKYAGSDSIDEVAWYKGNSGDKPTTHPVKMKKPNALGLYDMSGNVTEWCSDRYESYSSSSQTNPVGPSSGSEHVTRGGNYFNDAGYSQVACRGSRSSNFRNSIIGFRLVLDYEEDEAFKDCSNAEICGAYLKKYPKGKYVTDVRKKQRDFQAEDDAYARCTTAERCNEYLKKYPNGKYVAEVKHLLALKSTLTFTVNGVTFKMVYVEGGTFTKGCPGEAFQSEVKCDFHIGETEVTQALWKAVMGNRSWSHKGDDLPAEGVSYDECKEFCNKLNALLSDQIPSGCRFTLPTEEQWEYAARGGKKTWGYVYSGSNNLDEVAWNWRNSGDKVLKDKDMSKYWIDSKKRAKNNFRPHAVKTKLPNELGLYDMSGNVREMCEKNPGRDACPRGGCYMISEYEPRYEPCYRSFYSDFVGFRLSLVHE